jgi:hypothetical protein
LTFFGGDSGSPSYFEMLNGTWRTLGLHTNRIQFYWDLGDGLGPVARVYGVFDSTPRHLRWIESDSGFDLTPCHDWDGAKWVWSGNQYCAWAYDLSPETSGSSWPNCISDYPSTVTECAGWTPPNPDNKVAPSDADGILDVAQYGAIPPQSGALFGRPKLSQWTGSIGNDSLTSTSRNSTESFGGRGHDSLFVGAGADEIHGGSGNDLLYGGADNDVLVPGRGLDYVQGDDGNDKIIIRGTCEIVSGEVINGGAGTDTLYSPVNLATLTGMGVTVSSIETVVINNAALEQGTCAFINSTSPL